MVKKEKQDNTNKRTNMIILLMVIAVVSFGLIESNVISIFDTNETIKTNPQEDYFLSIAKGNIEGEIHVNKFGHNPDTSNTGGDIWTVGGDYIFPNENGTTQISIDSTSIADTLQITIVGLDENFQFQIENITLNGLSTVNVPGFWTAVFRAFNSNGIDLIGDAEIFDRVTPSIIYAEIRAEEQQTSMAIFTIPADYTGFLYKYYACLNSGGGTNRLADITLITEEFNKIKREKVHIGLSSNGNSCFTYEYPVPLRLEPKTNIILHGLPSASGSDISAGFDLILVNNTLTNGQTPFNN